MTADRLPDPILCAEDVLRAQQYGRFEVAPEPETREETVTLAVASARRWARRTDLSPELRLRRIWQVLVTALEEA